MSGHDLTIRNADDEPAVVVAITPLQGVHSADALATQARDAIREQVIDDRVATVESLVASLEGHSRVTDVHATDAGLEVLLDGDTHGVPIAVTRMFKTGGYRITSVEPHGSGEGLLVVGEQV